MVASGLQLYTNSISTGGSLNSVSARPRWFMLTSRVRGSGVSFIQAAALMPNAEELLMEKPPPRTPNFPATAGRAMIAAAALPPFRLRSSPQPQRTSAGVADAYILANFSSASGSISASAAARSMVHSRARARRSAAPRVCSARKRSSARPLSNK